MLAIGNADVSLRKRRSPVVEKPKSKMSTVARSSCMPIFRRASEPQWTYSTIDSLDDFSLESTSSEKYFSYMSSEKVVTPRHYDF